jgi:uncharacterized protein YeaO (DUF488 family)
MDNKNFKIFTIGFTGTTAENFFSRLSQAGVRKVVDTRLWADTQLSGFARKKDLPFLLKSLSGADYEHKIDLAPSENILKDFKNKEISWPEYETRYLQLLHDRHIADKLSTNDVADTCFLCAEKTPHHCHRRLLAEYLQKEWNIAMEIIHL